SKSQGACIKQVCIGTVEADAQLVASGMIEPKEIKAIQAAGGVGELLGHFFDAMGRILQTQLTARTLAVSFTEVGDQIIAIAGGPDKVQSIRAVLSSRRLKGLITDEATARALVLRK
ncbi:MAG: sugar-binding domain-containing protein, partial [Cypionkella sp.]|nr:sugar-binding domain-containing protein [Cypionkella sp.]